MANKYLDLAGLQRLVAKIKEMIPTKTSELDNDKGFITIEDIPGGETKITIRHQERFIVGTSSIFEFTKGYYTLNANSVNWYLDGIKQSNDALIEIDNRTIEVVGGLPEGSTVVFDYVEYTNTVIGLEGVGIEYQWNGTQLGIKREDEVNYQYQDLKGEKGDQGIQGPSGKNLEFTWNGTQLGIRQEGQTSYTYVDLKGDKGDTGNTGAIGKSIEFNWNGTSLGVKQEGQSTYQYVNLKGDKGDTGPQGPPGEAIADSVEWSNVLNKPSLVTQKTITSATEPTLNVGDQWHKEI